MVGPRNLGSRVRRAQTASSSYGPRVMKSYTRPVRLVLSLVALGASVWALYVHYRLLSDPTDVSVCDISETVSCASVLQSQYGTVAGVPVAAGGAIWSALVLMLA